MNDATRRHIRNLVLAWTAAAALIGTLGYWYYRPDAVPAQVRGWLPGIPDVPTATLYKWRDQRGRWHYSDEPPQDRPYQEVRTRSDVNVVSGQRSE